MGDTLKFDTEQIAAIAKATQSHQSQWDEIWNGVKNRLSAAAAEALSQEPGGSLEHRTQEYHRKTQQYNEQLHLQATSVSPPNFWRPVARCAGWRSIAWT